MEYTPELAELVRTAALARDYLNAELEDLGGEADESACELLEELDAALEPFGK